MDKINSLDVINEILTDIYLVKVVIICSALIGLFFGFIWMYVMRTFMGVFVWAAILIFLVSCFGASYYAYTLGVDR